MPEPKAVGRCLLSEEHTLPWGRKYSIRCLLDEGHEGRHNYQRPKKGDEESFRRFLKNRSERGMM